MNKIQLIAGFALAAFAAGAQADLIGDRGAVPAAALVFDFENLDGLVVGAGDSLTFGNGYTLVANQQFTAGQNNADLGENGVWGGNGNHFLSFDYVGKMSLDIGFNGQTTRGFAFDYSLYETDPEGEAAIRIAYYDAGNKLIRSFTQGFGPAFGADTYNQFHTTGYVSDSANIARISISGDGIVLDNLTYTQPVPEPEAYAMLLAGLGLLGAVARRRRQA